MFFPKSFHEAEGEYSSHVEHKNQVKAQFHCFSEVTWYNCHKSSSLTKFISFKDHSVSGILLRAFYSNLFGY